MGALQGTLTYKLFYVGDPVPDDFTTGLIERIKHRAFEALEPTSEEDEHYGWVPIENPLFVEFDLHAVLFDHFVNLGLRQDKWSLPSSLLKAHLTQTEREYRKTHDKDRLTKFEKEDLKEMVQKQLRERSLPKMKVFDMSWDLRQGRVRFWSQSAKTCELFQGLFEDTFGLKIVPANPYVTALEQELAPDLVAAIAEVEPSVFMEPHNAPSPSDDTRSDAPWT